MVSILIVSETLEKEDEMKYRIMSGRSDVPESVSRTFPADSDEIAEQEFEEVCKKESNQWDNLRLVRVDQEEITTTINRSTAKERSDSLPEEERPIL